MFWEWWVKNDLQVSDFSNWVNGGAILGKTENDEFWIFKSYFMEPELPLKDDTALFYGQ